MFSLILLLKIEFKLKPDFAKHRLHSKSQMIEIRSEFYY
jgi:hypothetical protein